MSNNKRSTHLEYVKHVPDFLAKMGLTPRQQSEAKAKLAEPQLSDKFASKKGSGKGGDDEEDKDDYDFENA
jgi:hypothetical protein